MSGIPKRPTKAEIYRDMLDEGEVAKCNEAHEHAVAKVAIQCLKNISVYAIEPHDGMTYGELSKYADDTVRMIEASGWKP